MNHQTHALTCLCVLLVGCAHESSGPETHAPAAVTTLTSKAGLKLVLIPAGQFVMGSPKSDADARDDEKPQHRVEITRPFYLGQTEVTQEQWKSVMGTEPWKDNERVVPEYFVEGPNHPANYVSWEDAIEFCQKLSKTEGQEYRLPTEAEWEYACRGGTTTLFSFGDDVTHMSDFAWWGIDDIGATGEVERLGNTQSERHPQPVGQKKPNPFGLFDMHGNVAEWCRDRLDPFAYGRRNDVARDPVEEPEDRFPVTRGGHWDDFARNARCAARLDNVPHERTYGLGFRVAMTPPDSSVPTPPDQNSDP